MSYIAEASDYDILDAGTYAATFQGITRGDDGVYGPYLQWNTEVMSPDGVLVKVTGRSSEKWGPNCKARRWLEALTGQKMVKGQPVDIDALIGRPCRIEVEVVEKEKGTFNRLEDVGPDTRTQVMAAAPSIDPQYAAWLAEREAKAAALAASNAEEPPAPDVPSGDQPDDDPGV